MSHSLADCFHVYRKILALSSSPLILLYTELSDKILEGVSHVFPKFGSICEIRSWYLFPVFWGWAGMLAGSSPNSRERGGQQWKQPAHPVHKIPMHQVPWLPGSNHPDGATLKIRPWEEQRNPVRSRLWCGSLKAAAGQCYQTSNQWRTTIVE